MFSETHSDSQRADRILASIRREEARPGRGLLKIFFGMAPGVGKTCAMLEAAIQAADKGVRVIIGVAESHGREDTMRLIGRLPRLPMKKMVYRGVEMEEFDLEEALRVKPQLILVDELAHTNVPGMRHRKRYQDVEDLLAAGIDVYTTLNVQHLESRSDTVTINKTTNANSSDTSRYIRFTRHLIRSMSAISKLPVIGRRVKYTAPQVRRRRTRSTLARRERVIRIMPSLVRPLPARCDRSDRGTY